MNKLQGFFALKESGLPCVPWMKYNKDTKLESSILWTIRSAVSEGNDLNLPRKVGVNSIEAKEFADSLIAQLKNDDLVIYYPYFIAKKSGVIEISDKRIVIEAVKADLWNLVTYNKKDVTIIFEEGDIRFVGHESFLSQDELFELIDSCVFIKKKFSAFLVNGSSVFLEWSYGSKSDIHNNSIGNSKLLFYEIRTV